MVALSVLSVLVRSQMSGIISLRYIIDLFNVHQFPSNVTSNHQPNISNHLNYLVPDWLSASTIL